MIRREVEELGIDIYGFNMTVGFVLLGQKVNRSRKDGEKIYEYLLKKRFIEKSGQLIPRGREPLSEYFDASTPEEEHLPCIEDYTPGPGGILTTEEFYPKHYLGD
jgi:hypothetical protein